MKFMLKSLIIVLWLGVFNLYGSDKDKKAEATFKAETKVTTGSSSSSSSSPKSEERKKKAASKAKKKKKKNNSKIDTDELINAILKGQTEEAIKLIESNKINLNYKAGETNTTALITASRLGYFEIVKLLIKNDADINAKNKFDDNALIYASASGYDKIVKLLLESGANFKAKNQSGDTALIQAIARGHYDIVKLLAEHADIKNQNGNLALLIASDRGHSKIVDLLLKHGADINFKDIIGNTALIVASSQGHYQVVELLLNHPKINNIDAINNLGCTALILAPKNKENAVKIIELLIKKGANKTIQDNYGKTYKYYLEQSLRNTLSSSSSPIEETTSVETESSSNLLNAILNNNVKEANNLIKSGKINLNYQDKDGCTALIIASSKGYYGITKTLLEKGAKIEAQDKNGITALLWACEKGQHAIAKLLLEKNANVNVQEKYGNTPLMIASSLGFIEIVELLLNNSAKVNERNKQTGDTALTIAAFAGNTDIIKFLIDAGADTTVKTKDGYNYLELLTMSEQNISSDKVLSTSSNDLKEAEDLDDKLANLEAKYKNLISFEGSEESESVLLKEYRRALVEAKLALNVLVEIFSTNEQCIKANSIIKNCEKSFARDKFDYNFEKLKAAFDKYIKLDETTEAKTKKEALDECNKFLKKIKDLNKEIESSTIKDDLTKIEKSLKKEVKDTKPKEQKEKSESESETKEEKDSAIETINDDKKEKPEKIESTREADSKDSGKEQPTSEEYANNLILTTELDKINGFSNLEKSTILKWIHNRIIELDIKNTKLYTPEFNEKEKDALEIQNSILKTVNQTIRNSINDLKDLFHNDIDSYVNFYEHIFRLITDEKLKDKLFDPELIRANAHFYENGYQVSLMDKTVEVAPKVETTVTTSSSSSSSSSPKSEEEKKESAKTEDDSNINADLINALIKNDEKKATELAKSTKINPNYKNINGFTALIIAAQKGYLEIARTLLEKGAAIDARDKWGHTALIWACIKGHDKITELLIKKGANINIQNNDGDSALIFASNSIKGYETVRYLLKQPKIKIDIQNNLGNTALMSAAYKDNLKIMQLLIDNNAKINAQNHKGNTALMIAIIDSKLEAVKLLLNSKADVNIPNKKGFTVLMEATGHNHIQIMQLLIKNNANIDAQNIKGNTALMIAIIDNKTDAINLLLSNNADVNIPNKDGLTLLMDATYQGNLIFMKLLLDHNAKINAKNKEGKTALTYAIESDKQAAARLLLKYKAKKSAKFSSPKISSTSFSPKKEKQESAKIEKHKKTYKKHKAKKLEVTPSSPSSLSSTETTTPSIDVEDKIELEEDQESEFFEIETEQVEDEDKIEAEDKESKERVEVETVQDEEDKTEKEEEWQVVGKKPKKEKSEEHRRAKALALNIVKPLMRGSTGRTKPKNLDEKLAMLDVQCNPENGVKLSTDLQDDRWPTHHGWRKMSQVIIIDSKRIEIHYVANTDGSYDDFKFKDKN